MGSEQATPRSEATNAFRVIRSFCHNRARADTAREYAPRMSRVSLRPSLVGLVLLSLAPGCVGELPRPVAPTSAECVDGPERCEEALTRAVARGDDATLLLQGLADAESAKGAPALAAFLAAVDRRVTRGGDDPGGAPRALVVFAGVKPGLEAEGLDAPALAARSLALWVAVAETRAIDTLFVSTPEGWLRVFGRDPVRKLVAGALPVMRIEGAPVFATDVAVDAAVRRMLGSAGKFDYVAAARAHDELAALLAKIQPWEPSALRARAAMTAVNLAPMSLLAEDEPDAKPTTASWPASTSTAYYELLRYEADPAPRPTKEARLTSALEALPTAQRAWFERRYREKISGCAPDEAPRFERPEDLGLATFLPSLLARDGARDTARKLPLADWDARYAALVDLTEREEAAYLVLPALLAERGGFAGMNRSNIPAQRKVTAMAKRHLAALATLAEELPGRVTFSQLLFASRPGAFLDRDLAPTISTLSGKSSSDAIAEAKDAKQLLLVAVGSAFVSFNMAPPARDAFVGSLATAFAARLRDDLAKEVGFWAGAAHAADLAFRAALGLPSKPDPSIAAISRAFEGAPDEPEAGLLFVASALAQYGLLATQGGLGAVHLDAKDAPLPARDAARKALAKALARLHPAGPPDPEAARELAAFVDNVAATLAYAVVAESLPVTDACKSDDRPVDPKLRRALGKLRDQRKKVLASSSLGGDGPWAVRARLLAVLLSDGLDVASAWSEPASPRAKTSRDLDPPNLTKFTVPASEVDRAVARGLASFGVSGEIAAGLQATYALGRGYLQTGTSHFTGDGRADLAAMLAAASALWGTDPSSLSTLLLEFGRAFAAGDAKGTTARRFFEVAGALFEQGKRVEADMVLVSGVVASNLSDEEIPAEAVALARGRGAETAWLLDFARAIDPRTTTPTSFSTDLAKLANEQCIHVSVEPIAGVLSALDAIEKGEDRGRLALEKLLATDDPKLHVPRVSYNFRHASGHQASNVTLSLDLAAPLVKNGSGFNFGLGFSSEQNDYLELDVSIDPVDAKEAREGTGRWYVHANALAAVAHFLAGDVGRGEEAAMRALGPILARTRFADAGSNDTKTLASGAVVVTFSVLAELALAAERPLLAGDLLQVARKQLGARPEEDLATLFDDPPSALLGVPGAKALLPKARATLSLAASGLPCAKSKKLDKEAFVQPVCGEYSRAIALRAADAVVAHPRLRAGKRASECEHGVVDGFLRRADEGTYDPEKLVAAVLDLQQRGKRYDAWALLTRLRSSNHCTAPLHLALSKAIEETQAPTYRADLLSARLNCSTGGTADELGARVRELQEELRRVGDPSRELSAGVIAAALAASRGEPKLALVVPGETGFLQRHRLSLGQLPAALFLDHASKAMNQLPIDVASTEADYELVCGAIGTELGLLCDVMKKLRDPQRTADEKKQIAEDAVMKAAR